MNKANPEISDIPELLELWTRSADSLRKASDSRNFSLFSRAFRKGSDSLNAILAIVTKNGKESVASHRTQIDALLAQWQSCSELLPPWMDEIQEKMKKKRKTSINDKKILNAYNFIKKSGNNLRVKAK